MIGFIVTTILGLAWLGYGTNWLTVRLPVGAIVKKRIAQYARYEVYNILKNRKPNWGDTTLYKGGNLPEGYAPNGEPCYTVILNPGIDSVLCGWDWLNEHCADMVDYQPEVFMTIGNVRYNMTIKQPSIIKDIMKANKIPKKELALLRG